MFKLFRIILSFVSVLAVFTSCDTGYLTEVEPDHWQKAQFQKQVTKALRQAAQSPGITDGTTLIVSMTGDTLLAPADSAMRVKPARTVYVELQSPEYPKTVSSKALAIFTTAGIVGLIIIVILIIIFGVFITVWRRQRGRNRTVSEAITNNYTLPESFYTGQPSQGPVTIYNNIVRTGSKNTTTPDDESTDNTTQRPPVSNMTDTDTLRDIMKLPSDQSQLKQLRLTFCLIGIGIFIFLGLAASGEAPAGFIFGGIPLVIGVSRLLSNIFIKRL